MTGILINLKKNTYSEEIEGKTAVSTTHEGVQLEIFDAQIEVCGSVSTLSAGFRFDVEIKECKLYYKSGFAVLFGVISTLESNLRRRAGYK